MLGKIVGFLYVISFIFAMLNGNTDTLCNAALQGAADAVTLTVSLMGMMCLWSGVMNVLKASGITDKLAHLLNPILRIIFPDSCSKDGAAGEISAAITANLLGLGNAATPLALKAMEKLQLRNNNSDEASNDMATFTVLSTASANLLPTTLIVLRRTAQSAEPFEVIVPIWIVSSVCACAAIIFSKAFAVIFPKKGQNN